MNLSILLSANGDAGGAMITVIVALVMLIVFFVLVSNVAAIKRMIQHQNNVKGLDGVNYKCPDCNHVYMHKLPNCPKCGKERKYSV